MLCLNLATQFSKSGAAGKTFTVSAFPNPSRTPLLLNLNRHTQAVVFTISVVDASVTSSFTSNLVVPVTQATFSSYLKDLSSEITTKGVKGLTQVELLGGMAGEQVNRIQFPGFNESTMSSNSLLDGIYLEQFSLGKTVEIKLVPPFPGVSQFGGDPGVALDRTIITTPGTGSHPYHQHVSY